MDSAQESELVGQGDCQLHWHAADRRMDNLRVKEGHQNTTVRSVTGAYSVTKSDDILLCPSGGTITFPLANNGRELEVIMTGTTSVTVNLAGTDEIYGETSVLLNVEGMALHFKAVTGGWVLI